MDVQVTLYIHTCSGRNRIIFLMRRPNTDSTPKKPITLLRKQLLIRYAVTSPVHTETIRGNVTSVYSPLDARVKLSRLFFCKTWHGRSGVRDPVRVRFPGLVETVPEVQTVSCAMGTGFFSPGVKQPVYGVHPPLSFQLRGRVCVELCL